MTTDQLAPPLPAISRRRKAAMIVHLLLSDGNKLALADLPEQVQKDLAHELGEIRLVDKDTINAVAAEFVTILESIGLSAPGGAAAALEALSEHISPALAQKLRAELDGQTGQDPWARLITLEQDQLLHLLQTESIEVGAIVLSKLPTETAAEILGRLPGDKARRMTLAISRTEDASIDALQRIGKGLVQDYCKVRVTAFEKPPVNLLGDILNSAPAAMRAELLQGLDEGNADLAKNVRKAIFTFENIPERLSPTDIPAALRVVAPEDLSTAMAYAQAQGGPLAEAAAHVLANISKRMAAQIEEEAAEMGTVSDKAGEQAMNKVTGAIRALADDGTIKLIVPEEAEAA